MSVMRKGLVRKVKPEGMLKQQRPCASADEGRPFTVQGLYQSKQDACKGFNRRRGNNRHECCLAVALLEHLALWPIHSRGVQYRYQKPGNGRTCSYLGFWCE